MLTDFVLLAPSDLDAARLPVCVIDDPSFDAEKLGGLVANAPRFASRGVQPEDVEALARALGVDARVTTWPLEGGALVELPENLCAALAAVRPDDEQVVGRRWARRARADGLANLLAPLARLVRQRREGQRAYLVIVA
ncbi:MAG: hypothetical protein R3B99_08210 [Polyangiales bacterium]